MRQVLFIPGLVIVSSGVLQKAVIWARNNVSSEEESRNFSRLSSSLEVPCQFAQLCQDFRGRSIRLYNLFSPLL